MLGEKHDLISEFSSYSDRITEMRKENSEFKEMSEQYDLLDKQIRILELDNAPISDTAFNKLKKNRAYLKDRLYLMITK